mgnify:CR=1 FL=1
MAQKNKVRSIRVSPQLDARISSYAQATNQKEADAICDLLEKGLACESLSVFTTPVGSLIQHVVEAEFNMMRAEIEERNDELEDRIVHKFIPQGEAVPTGGPSRTGLPGRAPGDKRRPAVRVRLPADFEDFRRRRDRTRRPQGQRGNDTDHRTERAAWARTSAARPMPHGAAMPGRKPRTQAAHPYIHEWQQTRPTFC